MNEIITFTAGETVPERIRVLAAQGVPADRPAPDEIEEICDDAIGLLLGAAEPRGLVASISTEGFAPVFDGEGENAPDTPVAAVYRSADHLALYAATLGERVTETIRERFEAGDYATASMLDAAASLMADSLSDRLAQMFMDDVATDEGPRPQLRVLPYSPGYCGWHVSGQRSLFAKLRPERIGITLNECCLMSPIKSVSGVLIAAPAEAHRFRPDYPFCSECKTRSCLARIKALNA